MSNFKFYKKIFSGIVFFFLSLIVWDFILYEIFYKLYDKENSLGKIKKETDILFIGSSNILWDVDHEMISQKLKKKTILLAVAGGDIDFRYHIAKEYIERHRQNLPDLIVFHTDRHVFRKDRYPSQYYLPLQGYYHKGILKDFLYQRWKTPEEKIFNTVFHSYTLNNRFSFIGFKLYDRFAGPVSQIVNFSNSSIVDLAIGAAVPEAGVSGNKSDKISEWKKKYSKVNASVINDQEDMEIFYKTAELFNENKIQAVFLETPEYDLLDGPDPYREVRDIIQSRSSEYIRYIRINPEKIEKDFSLYFDPSHMNYKGRFLYTKLLTEELAKYIK